MILKIAFLAVTLVASFALAASPEPHMAIKTFNELAQPLPLPYDEQADAGKLIAAAKARAKASGKLLVIDLGGNWCPDCRVLAGTMAQPELRAYVEKHFELVMINIGRYDKNMNVPAHYGLGRPKGVPSLLMIDPKTDVLINKGHTEALADARYMSPQALADWLASWAR